MEKAVHEYTAFTVAPALKKCTSLLSRVGMSTSQAWNSFYRYYCGYLQVRV